MLTSSLLDLLPGQPAAALPGAPPPSGDGAAVPDFALTLGGLLAGSSPTALAMSVAGERQLPAAGGKDVPVLAGVAPVLAVAGPHIEGDMSPAASATVGMPQTVAHGTLRPPSMPLRAPVQGDDVPTAPVEAKADKAVAAASPAAEPDRDDPDPPLVPELAWLLPPPLTAPPPGPAFVIRSALPETDAVVATDAGVPSAHQPEAAKPSSTAAAPAVPAPTNPTTTPSEAGARASRGRERRSPEAAAARAALAQATQPDAPEAPAAPATATTRSRPASSLDPRIGSSPNPLTRAADALTDHRKGASPMAAQGAACPLPEAAPASAGALAAPGSAREPGLAPSIAALRTSLSPVFSPPATTNGRPTVVTTPAAVGRAIPDPSRSAPIATAMPAAPVAAARPTIPPAGPPLARAAKAAGPIAAARLEGGAPTDSAQSMLGTSAAPAPAVPLAVAGASPAQHPSIDLTREPGLHRMIDHIEQLRDAADARDTRIRLVPDSLGPVEIAVRRADGPGGDAVRVHFTAAEASTRQLIADAQPRLTELAEARGVRIERATIDAGSGGDAQSRPQHQPPPAHPRAPARAATAATLTESTDERIA